MKLRRSYVNIFMAALVLMTACSKGLNIDNGPITPVNLLGYGDSIFYVHADPYQRMPVYQRQGIYRAYPDNLLIDSLTGAITVAVMGKGYESQTGLRYKITFQPEGSNRIDSTFIVIAGLNYLDRIYNLSEHDTLIRPVYNARLSNALPGGTYGINPDSRLDINPVTGEININKLIEKGMFDTPLEHGEWEEVRITYKSADKSNQATNYLDIALYYYNNVQSIPHNITEVMRAHQAQVLGVEQPAIPITTGPYDNDLPDNISIFKPRPPCIIIVGN